MPILSYDDIKPRNYVNTTAVGTIAGQELMLQDIVTAGILGKLNFICKGQKSTGKTQLMRDIYSSYFGGEEHSLWEMGRSDFRPRDLFEKLNISLAKGQAAKMPEITTFYDKESRKLRHFIKQYNPAQTNASLTEITETEAEEMTRKYSTTSDSILELVNTDKNFFCIDEYTRCPEVVMNLFYSLMTGEANHQGRIVQLGGNYYSGMAAVNPEDYSGTFKMDAAMWARFHVALDFDAYRTSAKDRDELTRRNLSPDVHPSETRDLLPKIITTYESIKAKKPTIEERAILQYFQTGLDACTKQKQSKELICWPKPCFTEGCKKATNTCGMLKGLDQRSIRAVYRLAKGIEEVARIKSGNDGLDIDPLDSFMLAYEFVAPYKGCINPKMTKEKSGIEALVLKEHIGPIKAELSDKMNSLRGLLEKTGKTTIKTTNNIDRLKEQLLALDSANSYDAIEAETMKRYTIKRRITLDELKEQHPEILEGRAKDMLKEEVLANLPTYEQTILDNARRESNGTFDKLMQLKNGIDEQAFKKMTANKQISKDRASLNEELAGMYTKSIKTTARIIMDKLPPDGIIGSFKIGDLVKDSISKKIRDEALKKEIEYMPPDKEPLFRQELIKNLQEEIRQKTKKTLSQKKDSLFSEEFDFLRIYYEEALEER